MVISTLPKNPLFFIPHSTRGRRKRFDAKKIAASHPFKLQQGLLANKASGITSQTTVAPYHPMTRHNHTHRIVSHSPAHSLCRNRCPTAPLFYLLGNRFISNHLSIRDILQQFPHRKPKRSTLQPERWNHSRITSRKIPVEPHPCLVKNRQLSRLPIGRHIREILLPIEPQARQALTVARHSHSAQR